ncbi:MAG: 3-mercaptopyruvate sulfurtransferase [Candidatus Competibacterales bacterium]|nr:3-mercaptopyruvate sulfurtransferase [Candidatus Competibacterales bacterium]
MSDPFPPVLVDIDWLDRHRDPHLKRVDARFFLPNEGHDARAEYEAGHLPGAVFFDIDAISDDTSSLPHMLPSPERFAATVGALGIGDDDTVVCYDEGRFMGACRAWWMFRIYGHARVAVLDGGLHAWRDAGLPLAHGPETPEPAAFTPRWQPERVRSLDQVRVALEDASVRVLDARSPERFAGSAPEPRPGLRSGHMPGALNLPFTRLIDDDGRLRKPTELSHLFEQAGLKPEQAVIATCGSGVSAAVLLLALHLLGWDRLALYDGSWAEWGSRSDTPVTTGY